MKSKITKDEVTALAALTKLRLTDEELEQYTEEISDLLRYFEQLDRLDLNDVDPTVSVGAKHTVTRADVVTIQPATPEKLRTILPNSKSDYIQVKRMI